MDDKLQEIIDRANEDNTRLEEKVSKLRSRVAFCSEHRFDEEKRITLVELNAIEMVAFRQRQIIDELQDLLNAWTS